MNVRSTLISLLYRKALTASTTVRGKGVGEILTLMSNDVDKILDWFWTFPLGICAALQYIGASPKPSPHALATAACARDPATRQGGGGCLGGTE